jgi:hypothetical protein
MASSEKVKQYIAYWFQLGKPLIHEQGQSVLPQPVIQGNQYSPEFEAVWQQVLLSGGEKYHLDGTIQTVGVLLSDQWDIDSCPRCDMPVPLVVLGVQSGPCPCFDLPNWPNPELPQPRAPVNNRDQLRQIHNRLVQ